MGRKRKCQLVTDRPTVPWIIDITMCIGNVRSLFRLCVSARECLSDRRTVSNAVEFSLVRPSRLRVGRVRVVQRQCRTRQPSRNSGVCAPKQELHAYPFILENPCRSEALEIPYTYPSGAACNGLPHFWGCLAYLPAFTCTRLSHIFRDLIHLAPINNGPRGSQITGLFRWKFAAYR